MAFTALGVHHAGEDALLHLPLYVDTVDAAAFSLRPAHVARLEVHVAAGARLYRAHCSGDARAERCWFPARPHVRHDSRIAQRRARDSTLRDSRSRETDKSRLRSNASERDREAASNRS